MYGLLVENGILTRPGRTLSNVACFLGPFMTYNTIKTTPVFGSYATLDDFYLSHSLFLMQTRLCAFGGEIKSKPSDGNSNFVA